MDLLLIEMVPMAFRLADELASSSTTVTTTATNGKEGNKVMDEDEQREAAFRRLETLGYRVGQGLVERYGW